MTSVLAILFFWICLLRQGKQKEQWTNRTTWSQKVFTQWKKPSTKWKGSLSNERRYLQTIHLIRGYYPRCTKNSHNSTSKHKPPNKKWVESWRQRSSRQKGHRDRRQASMSFDREEMGDQFVRHDLWGRWRQTGKQHMLSGTVYHGRNFPLVLV